MPRTLPTEKIESGEEEYTISYKWGLKCKHCGHVTHTTSEADRVSCGACNRKNPREQIVGKYFEEYLKYTLFTGDEETTRDVIECLQEKAKKYKAMEENGWGFDCTTSSSHVALSKGDVPPQEIIA